MKERFKYKLAPLLALTVCAVAAAAAWLTHIPSNGLLSGPIAKPSFSIGYAYPQHGNASIQTWLESSGTSVLFAPSRMDPDDGSGSSPPTSLFPLPDTASGYAGGEDRYSYLPAESLPGFGKSVYALDYGEVRMLALSSPRMDGADADKQLHWMSGQAEKGISSRVRPIVILLDQPPELPAFWSTASQAGASLVIAGGTVYVRSEELLQPPAELEVGSKAGWSSWKPERQTQAPFMLAIEGKEEGLAVIARTKSGADIDQLLLHPGSKAAALQRQVLVDAGYEWLYRPGGDDLAVTIPDGFDLTGEHPPEKRLSVSAQDWRSPPYDDSNWTRGSAPLGSSPDAKIRSSFGTQLPAKAKAPSYYFRTTFTMPDDPEAIAGLYADLSFEDGVAVYLNGEEIIRSSIATGLLTPYSLADPNEPVIGRRYSLNGLKNRLKKGENTLAAEIHRNHPGAASFRFGMSLAYTK